MIEHNSTLESNFDAALSSAALADGESKHANIEKLRKVAMAAGLTKSSSELEAICKTSPKEYQDALEFGLQSYEHYLNLIKLLENAVLRIYSVGANNSEYNGFDDNIDFEERVALLLSSKSGEDQH